MNLAIFSNFYELAAKSGILFYYTGEFSPHVIGAMSDTLKKRLDTVGISGPSRRKIFSAFIEMAQNIMHYARDAQNGASRVGAIAIGEANAKYWIVSGNSVPVEQVERIKNRVEPLRSMTIDEIKLAYKEQLRNEAHESSDELSRGAGLGFLTVAREASEPLEYQIVYRSDRHECAEFYLRAAI